MIDLYKKYKTRSGNPVVLFYDIVDNKIFGRFFKNGQWYSCDWNKETGKIYPDRDGEWDLVEISEFSVVSNNSKKVTYFGIELTVPIWVNWIAVDRDGEIQLFDDVPAFGSQIEQWYKQNPAAESRFLPINVGYTGDWKKSLQKV